MNKNRVLGIGIGQAGNNLLNAFLNKNKMYTGLFINSAYEDMSELNNFNYEKNAYVFPGESGSGRDREKAKSFVKSHIKSLADIFTKYPLHDTVIIFFSTDGGTGSGTSPMIIQTLRHTCPNKKINIVATLPNADTSDNISLENSLKCCEELAKIEDLVDDIKFVDNSKGISYEEINERVTNDLECAFSINGKHEEGNIDNADSKRVNTEKGYGMILRLRDNEPSLKMAIDNAYNNTIFAIPDVAEECTYLGISVKQSQYKINELKNQFTVSDAVYATYNNKFNVLVLGGCSAPNQTIEYIKLKLQENKENKLKRPSKKGLMVEIDLKDEINAKVEKKDFSKIKTSFSEDELDKLVDDLENLFG